MGQSLATGASMDVEVDEPDVWPLAIQGPQAEQLMSRVFGEAVREIRFFRYKHLDYRGHSFVVARSGWSKQGGFEVYVDNVELGQQLYDELFEKGADLDVRAGCPNLIERVESGLLAYGNDMDSRHSVLEASLGQFINLDADIECLSLDALRAEHQAGVKRRLVGFLVPAPDGPAPFAENAFIEDGFSVGEVFALQAEPSNHLGTQTRSPRYAHQMATAMLDEPDASATPLNVLLADGTRADARVCTLPFDFAHLGIEDVSTAL